MNSSTRVIVNTLSLYANMVVTMVVQLIAVRLIFKAMGIVDYGIYNIVAGSVVALLSFMNVAMAAATQRYLSYAIGQGDAALLKETFYLSVVLHLFIGVIVLLLIEGIGVYYVNYVLIAPEARLSAANILLQCITISTFVNVITVPYEADINANENMVAIAVINILDSVMKLGAAIYLMYTPYDRLIVYGVSIMSIVIITLAIKRIYCHVNYSEAHFSWHKMTDFSLMRKIGSFAGWNLIGTGCGTARYQGVPMILNQFFYITINAAYGVAQHVNGLLLFFANTIVRAIRPQIVKSEGSGDRQRMLRLSVTACRITSLMVAFMAIPLFIEMKPILTLWLGENVGSEYVMFCRCFLVIVFMNQLTIGLQIALESVGKIRTLQCVVGSMHILALPLGWICFKLGMPPVAIMLCIIVEEVLAAFVRVAIAHHYTGLNSADFILHTLLPCLFSVLIVLVVLYYSSAQILFMHPLLHIVIVTAVSCIVLGVLSSSVLLTKQEYGVVKDFFTKVITKLTVNAR